MKLALSSGKNYLPNKYLELRDEIRNGDILLYRGSSLMSKSIHYLDRAYYNHAGIVWIPPGTDRVLTLDMWSEGLACLPLSRRMSGYDDFCIMRPKDGSKIDEAIKSVIGLWDGREVKYDSWLCLRIAIIKKTGIDVTGLGTQSKFICSELVQYYTDLFGMGCFTGRKLITPEDFRRYNDGSLSVLYDDAPAPDMYYRGKKILCQDYSI